MDLTVFIIIITAITIIIIIFIIIVIIINYNYYHVFFLHTSYDLLFLFLDSSLERLGCSFNSNLVLDERRTASGAFVKQGTICLQSMQYLPA